MIENIYVNHKTFARLTDNDNITECGVYVYLCLKPMVNKSYTHIFTSVNTINRTLSDDDINKNNKALVKYIKTGLKELDEAHFIKIINNHNSDYELDLDGMIEDATVTVTVDDDDDIFNTNSKTVEKTNFFVTLDAKDLRQALKDCGNKKFIFYYLSCYLDLYTHNDDKFYFPATREDIAEKSGLDIRSIDKYNEILMNNHIIYYVRYNYKWKDSNKQVNNIYGLYKNKSVLDSEKEKFLKNYKDSIYLSSIPRGKGSKKQKEEKKAQYTPVEADEFVVTDEELAEHDKRHKELYAKRMKKAVMTESVSMQEVDKTVQADSKEETVQADDSEQEVQVDSKKEHKMTLEEFDRKWHNKPIQKVEKKKVEKVTEPVETHRVDRNEEYNVLMSELKFNSDTTFDKASKMFDDLLLKKYGFINETDDDKALKERFKNEWETAITVQKVEPIKEDEEANPFA